MKTKSPSISQRDQAARRAWYRRCIVVGAMLLSCGATARAGDTNAPSLTPQQMFEGGAKSYDNWVELGLGGLITSGNAAQAQQQYQLSNDPFGGVSDLHLQKDVVKGTTLTMDGHALFDQNDYKLLLGLQREEFGYIKFNLTDFRTWYNGAGGYFNGTQYQLPNDALSLDRGTLSVEAALTPKDLPKAVFKYTHSYRDGDKSSTIWGPVHPDLPAATVRNVFPSLYNINEKVDSYALDLTHHIKTTDFGAGVRYDTASLANTRMETFYLNDDPQHRALTDSQGTAYDLFNVHAFSETWLKKNLFFSTGYTYADQHDTFSGSRIYGDDFGVGYSPNIYNGLGYTSLHGGANEQQHVGNVNLMATPFKNLSIVPSLRVQSDNWNANSGGLGTFGTDATQPYSGNGNGEMLEVRERLDVRYTGVTNWVFSCGGEWTQGSGNLYQTNGLSEYTVIGIGPPPVLSLTDETRWFQKYSIGARWYPVRRVIIDTGGYYKRNEYDYNIVQDSTPNDPSSGNRYPAYLVMQNFQTYDGNVRVTLRPVQNVTLVSRYEYQYSTIDTAPDSVSGLGQTQSSQMTTHIIAQNASWTPWSRLFLQAGFNYVLSETKTPMSDYTQAVLNSQNNYWTVTFDSTVVVDDKTDLNVGFVYYRADNYNNNSSAGLPLGAGADEQTLTASISRRITPSLRVNLRYAYTHYNDWASGGNNNYDAQMVYSSLQYRF
jgi:hypothetical protein